MQERVRRIRRSTRITEARPNRPRVTEKERKGGPSKAAMELPAPWVNGSRGLWWKEIDTVLAGHGVTKKKWRADELDEGG